MVSHNSKSQRLSRSLSDNNARIRLVDLYVKAGFVTGADLADATRQTGTNQSRIGAVLVALKKMDQRQVDLAAQAHRMIVSGEIDVYSALRAMRMAHRTGATLEAALHSHSNAMPVDVSQKLKQTSGSLGEFLVNSRILTESQLAKAQLRSRATSLPLGHTLVLSGVLTERFLDAVLNAQQYMREGRLTYTIAAQALTIAFRHQLAIPARDLTTLDARHLKLTDLLWLSRITTASDVRNAIELALEEDIEVEDVLVRAGLIKRETLTAAFELMLCTQTGLCSLMEAAEELNEIQDAVSKQPLAWAITSEEDLLELGDEAVETVVAHARSADADDESVDAFSPGWEEAFEPGSLEQVAAALTLILDGHELDAHQIVELEAQYQKAQEDQRRFQNEIRDAITTGVVPSVSVAGLRNQAAETADRQMRDEMAGAKKRSDLKRRNLLIGGAVSLLALAGAVSGLKALPDFRMKEDLAVARKHLDSGMLEVARQEVKLALNKDAKNPEALLLNGRILFRNSDYAQALRSFEAAETNGADLNSADKELMVVAAQKEKQWSKAKSLMQTLLAKSSRPEMQAKMGQIHMGNGDEKSALENFSRAIAGGFDGARMDRGQIFLNASEFQKAIEDFDVIIAKDDGNRRAHFLRGQALLKNGKPESALADFAKSEAIGSPDAKVFLHQALAYNQLGLYDKALDAANHALSVQHESVPALLARGDAFMGRQSYARAEEDFDAALRIEPTNPLAEQKKHEAYVAYRRIGPEAPKKK